MLPTERNLDSIYFRVHNPQTNGYENRCFTDLDKETQIKLIKNRNKEWLQTLILYLAETVREMGDEFDIIKVGKDEIG